MKERNGVYWQLFVFSMELPVRHFLSLQERNPFPILGSTVQASQPKAVPKVTGLGLDPRMGMGRKCYPEVLALRAGQRPQNF